tara:strand:- start:395 stop:877 length:483 start_codon:yes stop_codon:yes gene_type:complete
MKLNKIILISFTLLFLIDLSYSQNNYRPGEIGSSIQLTGEDYITGEDGVPRMSINIWGNVKYPGTYLVYDDIDLLTSLSIAGGPLKGSKLSKIIIISDDGSSRIINLDKLVKNNELNSIKLNPYDTIKIDEKFSYLVLTKTSIIAVFLQLINVILTATEK